MSMRKWILAMTVAVLCGVCLAGTRDPSVADKEHLNYGAGFHSVVRVEGKCGCGKGEDHMFNGSGVAIAGNWVVTAAHVVDGNKDIFVRMGDKIFPADLVIVHKDFDDSKVGYCDIALCRCVGDFGLDFYPGLYEESDEISKVASVAGYGTSGSFSTGAVVSDGKRRAGSNIVARTERDVLVCVLSDRKTKLEFLIAPGDSGGGLFIGNRLAGINSLVMADDGKPDSDYGDESAHTRVSIFVSWIRENMGSRKVQP